jgi:uncharacterized membrane protein YgaE (UPF0421/DUF939 family)
MPLAAARGPLGTQLRRLVSPDRPSRSELQLVAKMVLAGTLAWWLCTLLGQPRPLFAVLVPLVAMDGDAFASVSVSATRTVGVFAGVLLGLGLYYVHLPSTALVALLLAVSLAAGLLLRAHGAPVNNQVAITAMFMLYLGVAAKAEAVGIVRIWETAVGAAVAVGIAVAVWPPDPLAEVTRRVRRLHGYLADDLAAAARLLRDPDPEAADAQLDLVRERSLQAVRDVFEVDRGRRALRWNPRRRSDLVAFTDAERELNDAARQYRHLRTITRIVADAAEESAIPAGERTRIADRLDMLAAGDGHAGDALDPASLADPRAVGLALKVAMMVDDLPA